MLVAAATPRAVASAPPVAPHIESVSPSLVPPESATVVTVTGQRFVPFGTDVSVMIADVTYTPAVTVDNDQKLTFLMPATHATGRADLLVTTAAGTGYGALVFGP